MISLRAVGALLITLIVMACGNAAQGPSGSTAPAAAPTAATATPPPATPPIASPADLPPDARLMVEGGDPVVGQLGSFTFAGGGSDSPWLPGSPVAIGADEPVTVTLSDGQAIASWTARRAAAGATNGAGATLIGEGGAVVAFKAPGPGSWTVEVEIRFTSGGSATYYWRLDLT